MTQSVVEDISKPIESGNELYAQMLRFSRNLFGLAALALVAIAATVGAMYVLHEGTSSWVSESRELSRLARTAYVLTVERELSLIDDATSRPDAVALSIERSGATLGTIVDSLVRNGGKSPERASRIRGIEDARKRWLEVDTGPRHDELKDRRTSVEKKRFDVLRTRLALFVLAEDLRYGERLDRERTVRLMTSGAILFEVLVLLLVLNGIRNKLVSQATEVLSQKESLEKQASELEMSNRELAAAIEEKEKAFALIEDEAAEQSLEISSGN